MGFLIVALFLLVLHIVVNIASEPDALKESCKGHNWVYKIKDGSMVCTKCGMVPGAIKTKNGDYE